MTNGSAPTSPSGPPAQGSSGSGGAAPQKPSRNTPFWISALGGPVELPAAHERMRLASPEERRSIFLLLSASSVVASLALAALFWNVTANTNTPTSATYYLWQASFAFVVGYLGGLVHCLASLSHHTGSGSFYINWKYFYYTRPYIGGIVAVFLYFMFEAGVFWKLSADVPPLAATIAWSALAGLFAQRMLEKFRDVVDALVPNRMELKAEAPPAPISGAVVPPSRDAGDDPRAKPDFGAAGGGTEDDKD